MLSNVQLRVKPRWPAWQPGLLFVLGLVFVCLIWVDQPLTKLEAWPGPPPSQPPVPVRVVAGADVEVLRFGQHAIREYLDVYNDDGVKFLEVRKVTADTWIGHRKDRQGEEWSDQPFPIMIAPNSIFRVAERQRQIEGLPLRNWWVRWLRFKVDTDRGVFTSNFADSPQKPPSKLRRDLHQPEIDSLSSPGLRSPTAPGVSARPGN